MRYLLLVIALCSVLSCKTNMQRNAENPIYEEYKDVFILAQLIEADLRASNGETINLRQTVRGDSLNRISTNFELLEEDKKYAGGYKFHYKFSSSRNSNITLTDEEKKKIILYRWTMNEQSDNFDGELRFAFGERFFNIQRIIVN